MIGAVCEGVDMPCASLSYPFSLIKLLPTSSAATGSARASKFRDSERSDISVDLSVRFGIRCNGLESREDSRLRSLPDQPLEECEKCPFWMGDCESSVEEGPIEVSEAGVVQNAE